MTCPDRILYERMRSGREVITKAFEDGMARFLAGEPGGPMWQNAYSPSRILKARETPVADLKKRVEDLERTVQDLQLLIGEELGVRYGTVEVEGTYGEVEV